jgi:hypothetical protein
VREGEALELELEMKGNNRYELEINLED